MTEKKKTATSLALLLALCLAARLAYVGWYLQEPRPVQGDGYPEIAESILHGKGFSVAPLRLNWIRTPGYPLFIAAVWTVVPPSARYVALLLAQVVVSVAACGLLFVLADAVFGRSAACTATFFVALSPSNIVHATLVLPETLQLFWIALAALLALQLYRTTRLRSAIAFGLVWGVAGLTRPEATFLLAPLLLPTLVARQEGVFARLSACATAVLAKIAVMAPWVARNYLVYGTFVLHVPVGGLAFAGAAPPRLFTSEIAAPQNGQENRGEHAGVEGMPAPRISPRILIIRNERAILEVNRKLTTHGLTVIQKRTTSQELLRLARHFSALWRHPSAWWEHWGVDPPEWLEWIWQASYAAFMALFVLGVFVSWNSGKLGVVPLSWLILMAGHTAVFLVIYAVPRYQVTSAFFVYIFSGLGASAVLHCLAMRAPRAASSGANDQSVGWNGMEPIQDGESFHGPPVTKPGILGTVQSE
jgi:4-amino-4-deoxy-L-arabinose transferase-like glycosyltransferase